VRKRGFEPPRSCDRQPLKLVRLPFRHFRVRGDFVDSPNLSATTAGSSATVCRFSRSSWHFRFLTTDDNGGLPVRDSEQYMGEAGRRQTGHGTPTLRPQPRLERRNYRESWNLLKEHFDGVKVTDIDTRFLLGLSRDALAGQSKKGAPVRRLVLRHAATRPCRSEPPASDRSRERVTIRRIRPPLPMPRLASKVTTRLLTSRVRPPATWL
jgi:hypothetical protein